MSTTFTVKNSWANNPVKYDFFVNTISVDTSNMGDPHYDRFPTILSDLQAAFNGPFLLENSCPNAFSAVITDILTTNCFYNASSNDLLKIINGKVVISTTHEKELTRILGQKEPMLAELFIKRIKVSSVEQTLNDFSLFFFVNYITHPSRINKYKNFTITEILKRMDKQNLLHIYDKYQELNIDYHDNTVKIAWCLLDIKDEIDKTSFILGPHLIKEDYIFMLKIGLITKLVSKLDNNGEHDKSTHVFNAHFDNMVENVYNHSFYKCTKGNNAEIVKMYTIENYHAYIIKKSYDYYCILDKIPDNDTIFRFLDKMSDVLKDDIHNCLTAENNINKRMDSALLPVIQHYYLLFAIFYYEYKKCIHMGQNYSDNYKNLKIDDYSFITAFLLEKDSQETYSMNMGTLIACVDKYVENNGDVPLGIIENVIG